VDAANRFAVTASDDKTVRVWSLPDGHLARVLRLPIDLSNIGKAFAVAISPDASTVAVGGWTGRSGHENIFIFGRESGRLLTRLGDLPNVVLHLNFSQDGRRLVATLSGSNGIRVFNVHDHYRQLPSDTRYGAASYWAAFDSSARLVTTSDDGFTRLYAVDHYDQPIARSRTPDHRPYTAAFSPNGNYVGVGYDNSSDVAVLSGADLTELFKADVGGIPDVSLSAVAWSEDGRFLFAGGNWYKENLYQVRRWGGGGRGSFVDIPVTSDAIAEILGLNRGRMLFASTREFGMIDADARPIRVQGLEALDLSSGRGSFRISEKGDTVQVDSVAPTHTYRFALGQRQIDFDPSPDPSLLSSAAQAVGLSVTDWYNSRLVTNWNNVSRPVLNGAPLVLEPLEISRSLAVVRGTNHFVLGTEWLLRLFDRNGHGIWAAQRIPGAAWHVDITPDGRLIVAALGDGTIRWYRMSDGVEVLSLFMHPDGVRWIAWTPQGYYDASLGADDLIGWHINHGYDRPPDFYPVSQFRDRFYRPDVIKRVLYSANLAVPEAVKAADNAVGQQTAKIAPVSSLLQPVVEIYDPKDPAREDHPHLELAYSVRLPSAQDILNLDTFIDGAKQVVVDRRLSNQGDAPFGILTLAIPRRDSVVSVVASNRNGASMPALVHVDWTGAATEPKPMLYVLAIGISKYKDTDLELQFADKDANDFITAMKAQAGRLYEKVILPPQHESLRNEDATKEAILNGLDWISGSVTNINDVAMVFIAGHGLTKPDQNYAFLPYDYDAHRGDYTSIDQWDLKRYLTRIGGKKIFFFDTCYSGQLLGTGSVDSRPNTDKFGNELKAAENGITVFASSTGKQLSQETEKEDNGVFTKAVVEGILGLAARPGLTKISVSDLNSYVSRRVRELTVGKQTPVMAIPKTVQDYWIAQRLN
jgi:WD40 repeat protein